MTLRPATAQDFAFIRALVQGPEHAAYLTDEDEAALGNYVSDCDSELLIWQRPDQPQAGFALFCGMNKKSRTVELRRLALAQVGLGHGAGFLDALLVYGFETLNAGRVWLDTAETNLRAQKVYAGAGFTLEGRLRKHDYCPPLQQNLDTLLYGMMRDEWQASKS